MNKVFRIVMLMFVCLVTGCNKTRNAESDETVAEAQAIADSLNDVGSLQEWIAYYKAVDKVEAAMLIRQKLGSVLRNNSEFDEAVKQHDTCIVVARSINDTLQLIIALNNQGTNFRRLGDLNTASKLHYEALNLCDKTAGDTTYVAKKNVVCTLNGLGNILLSMKNYDVAEEMFRRALAGEERLGSATGMAINYANIGAIMEATSKMDSARTYYNMSMEKNVETNNLVGISLCYQHIGSLDLAEGNRVRALENYRKSYGIGMQTTDVWHRLSSCVAMADIYLDEQNVDSASKYINTGLTDALQINSYSYLADIYGQCSRLHEMTGRYDQAMRDIKMRDMYEDSVVIEKNLNHINNVRVRYETDKRTEEVNAAKSEAERERTVRKIFIYVCVLLLIALIVTIVYQTMTIRKHRGYIVKKEEEIMDMMEQMVGSAEKTRKMVVQGEATKQAESVQDECSFRQIDVPTGAFPQTEHTEEEQCLLKQTEETTIDELLSKVNKHIKDNIANCNFNASMLAELVLMSTTTLNRKIKAITNMDTTHYIRLQRLNKAKYLLTNTKLSMGEIQAECGFESPSYFSRAFKSEFDISPTEFKKKLLSKTLPPLYIEFSDTE
ncbi:MAG: tetratricopeptide repeat protein [Prevotellaceae bacterium]|nr:tetratricopeptide repeat protein [Candidatus Minthosoma caballi]